MEIMRHTDCGNGGDDFTELELVQNSRLSGGVETDHQNAHLLLAPEAVEQLRECETHGGGWSVVCARVGYRLICGRKGAGLVSCAAQCVVSKKPEIKSVPIPALFTCASLVPFYTAVNVPAWAKVAYVSPPKAQC